MGSGADQEGLEADSRRRAWNERAAKLSVSGLTAATYRWPLVKMAQAKRVALHFGVKPTDVLRDWWRDMMEDWQEVTV